MADPEYRNFTGALSCLLESVTQATVNGSVLLAGPQRSWPLFALVAGRNDSCVRRVGANAAVRGGLSLRTCDTPCCLAHSSHITMLSPIRHVNVDAFDKVYAAGGDVLAMDGSLPCEWHATSGSLKNTPSSSGAA